MSDTPKPGTLAFEKARNAELVRQCDKLHRDRGDLIAALNELFEEREEWLRTFSPDGKSRRIGDSLALRKARTIIAKG